MSKIEEKAKTYEEISKAISKVNPSFATNPEEMLRFSKAFDRLQVEKWVRVEDARQEIDECKASWQNLKDTIPKFEAKISFLETRLKACNRLIDEMQRERGEQKQKIKQTCDEIRSKLKFLDYEQYHGDLKQSLNPTLREINQLLGDLLK